MSSPHVGTSYIPIPQRRSGASTPTLAGSFTHSPARIGGLARQGSRKQLSDEIESPRPMSRAISIQHESPAGDLQLNGMAIQPSEASELDLSSLPSGNVNFKSLPPVLKGYLLGQLACVIKFGVWWVGFSYLILAMFGGSSYLVGGVRICFNVALLFFSPLAGAFVERSNIKKLLNMTVLTRGVIYSILIPVVWLLLESGVAFNKQQPLHVAFFVLFLLIVFFDGIGVAFSNVADIDSGGVNIVAAQYGIDIDDNTRNYFNSLHILFFDLSMVVFNPLIAYLGLVVGEHAVSGNSSVPDDLTDEVTILGAMAFVFFLSTVATLLFYNAYMPKLAPAGLLDGEMAGETKHSWQEIKEILSTVPEGAKLTWNHVRIRWRVLFFAIETSVEDAMIALIAAEIGSEIFAPSGDLHYVYGNLWGAGLVACGKVGGVLASLAMHHYFVVPEGAGDTAFKPLFWFSFTGGCASLLMPVAYYLRLHSSVSDTVTTALMFIGIFLFFLFSTLSKVGFSTLMQSMAAEVEATGRVFGFVAAFVTGTDALLLMALSALFSATSLETALWCATAFIAVHGLIELIFGPALVLRREEDAQTNSDYKPLAE